MVHFFDFTELKERCRSTITDRRVNYHATLGEMVGTGMVVFIGTSAVQFANDALANTTSPDIGANLQIIDGLLLPYQSPLKAPNTILPWDFCCLLMQVFTCLCPSFINSLFQLADMSLDAAELEYCTENTLP
jgi:hypothetical protein